MSDYIERIQQAPDAQVRMLATTIVAQLEAELGEQWHRDNKASSAIEPTIQIMEPDELYVPDIGDVLWGAASDWATPPEGEPSEPLRRAGLMLNKLDGTEEDNQILVLGHIKGNTIEAAKYCGINTEYFRLVQHQDPELPFMVYGVVPIAILTDDTKNYSEAIRGLPFADLILDFDWHKEMNGTAKLLEINRITEMLMGSGYSYGCSTNDGGCQRKYAKLKLSNGDWLYVAFWEWYNK